MNKYTKYIPVFAGLLLLPGTRLYALDGSKVSSNLIGAQTSTFENISSAKLQKMYLVKDAKIFTSNSTVSAVLKTQLSGSQVSILSVDGDMCQVLTDSGTIGYVNIDLLTSQKEYIFISENLTMYVAKGTELKSTPFENGEVALTADKIEELQLTGSNSNKYWRVQLDGNTYYVDQELLSSKKLSSETTADTVKTASPTIKAAAAVSTSGSGSTSSSSAASSAASSDSSSSAASDTTAADSTADDNTSSEPSITWTGRKLTPSAGTITGPSGKETYYNLDMSRIVSIMQAYGNYTYWVRDDGVKMLGNYVMVAANFYLRPRGSLIETSLGIGIVCDTGGFALNNPTQLDIAVDW